MYSSLVSTFTHSNLNSYTGVFTYEMIIPLLMYANYPWLLPSRVAAPVGSRIFKMLSFSTWVWWLHKIPSIAPPAFNLSWGLIIQSTWKHLCGCAELLVISYFKFNLNLFSRVQWYLRSTRGSHTLQMCAVCHEAERYQSFNNNTSVFFPQLLLLSMKNFNPLMHLPRLEAILLCSAAALPFYKF